MFNVLAANIVVKPGNGGNGSKASSIHNRALIYHGGNGGHGGNIIIQYSKYLLINNKFKLNNIIAEDGQDGKPGKKDGKNGADLIVYVSRHCIITDTITEQILTIIDADNTTYIIPGALGGYGSRVTRTTEFTEYNKGEKSQKYKLSLYAVLPSGSIHIFNTMDVAKIKTLIELKWQYKANTDNDIICLEQNNKFIYIIPYCNHKTIDTIEHIESFGSKQINIYTEHNTYNPYLQHIYEHYGGAGNSNLKIHYI